MATFTENYNLIKPDEADYYDVADFNENFDAIDEVMAAAAQGNESISEKIGSPTDTGDSTVFGLLKTCGGSSIKSIQRVSISMSSNGTSYSDSKSASIAPIVPEKCIVLLDRMGDATSFKTRITYTLETDTLSVSGSFGASGSVHLLFQIIEFQ